MSSYKNLFEFLQDHKTTKDRNTITHTRIPGVDDKSAPVRGGSYHIPDEELPMFYKLYHQHVFVNKKPEYLTEAQRHDGNIPILVDLDFRYDPKIKSRQHSIDHIQDLLELYMEAFKHYFDMSEDPSFKAYVFEKANAIATDPKQTKDGIHIVFGLHANHIQQLMIRDYVLARAEGVLNDLPLTNNYGDVFDECIPKGKTNWQVFGSKKPGNLAYQLTHVFNLVSVDEGEMFDVVAQSKRTIKPLDILTKCTARSSEVLKLNMREEHLPEYERRKNNVDKKIERKLANSIISGPSMLSGGDGSGMFMMDYSFITNKEQLSMAMDAWFNSLTPSKFHLKETHMFTMTLPEEYYRPGSYEKWIRVGWALANTSPNMFLTWVCFSSQSPHFDYSSINELHERWLKFEKNNPDGLTARSIMYWCKTADPKKYKEVKRSSITELMKRNQGSIKHHDVANVVYEYYKDEYRCVSTKRGGDWYRFQKHRWVHVEGGSSLRIGISQEISQLYAEIGTDYLRQSNLEGRREEMFDGSETHEREQEASKKKSEKLQEISGEFAKISNDLRDVSFKRNIMSEVADIFYENDPDFINLIDSNIYLVCFENGVYDFQTNEFRDGVPEDYITKSTNLDYIPINREDEEHKKILSEIDVFMAQLFVDESLREYMWQHLASILIGKNHPQTINIYNGTGSNGKSVLVDLIDTMLGEYSAPFPISYITSKRAGAGQVTPEIAELVGVRFAYMSEPNKNDKINDGVMKEITGCDIITANPKYRDPITFRPQFKLVMCLNNLPEIESNDDGTWRRIRVCEFESKFSTEIKPCEQYPYVFPPDFKLTDKIKKHPLWTPLFTSLLVEKAAVYKGMVTDCDKVMAASNEYRADQDCFLQFFNERIERGESDDVVKDSIVKEEFKEWYQANYSAKPPRAKELVDFLNKQIGKKARGRGWVGYKIVYDDADADPDEFQQDD